MLEAIERRLERLPEPVRIGAACLLWLAVGGGLFFAAAVVDVSMNFFDWDPSYEWPFPMGVAVGIGLIPITVALVRRTRGRVATTVAILVAVGLAGFGLYLLPAEPVNPGQFLGAGSGEPSLVPRRPCFVGDAASGDVGEWAPQKADLKWDRGTARGPAPGDGALDENLGDLVVAIVTITGIVAWIERRSIVH